MTLPKKDALKGEQLMKKTIIAVVKFVYGKWYGAMVA